MTTKLWDTCFWRNLIDVSRKYSINGTVQLFIHFGLWLICRLISKLSCIVSLRVALFPDTKLYVVDILEWSFFNYLNILTPSVFCWIPRNFVFFNDGLNIILFEFKQTLKISYIIKSFTIKLKKKKIIYIQTGYVYWSDEKKKIE